MTLTLGHKIFSVCLLILASTISVSAVAVEAQDQDQSQTGDFFESVRYGLKTRLPKGWPVIAREKNEYVFVCEIPQARFPDRPGILACEIAIAPESLNEYKTRIDGNAKRGNGGGSLTKNEVLAKNGQVMPERLESIWEFRLPSGEVWHEITVRVLQGKHLYSFVLNIEDEMLQAARPKLDAVISQARFISPDSGATQVLGATSNRWIQNEFHFVVDLPKDWAPLLAPNEAALLYANGKPKGIWADNMLVLATQAGKLDYQKLSKTFAADLEAAEPGCTVLDCSVVKTKDGQEALQTTVEVRRGPFSMTILEWRFPGKRYNYELKFTVESSRYDALKSEMQRCFESFLELPEDEPKNDRAKTD